MDPEWPEALKMSLATIWSMYEEETKQRLQENVLSAELEDHGREDKNGE